MARKLPFKLGDYVVYPSHGVGKVTGIEFQQIGDVKLKVFVVAFEKEKMTLRVPVDKAIFAGMRKLSSPAEMKAALSTLRRPARVKRGVSRGPSASNQHGAADVATSAWFSSRR